MNPDRCAGDKLFRPSGLERRSKPEIIVDNILIGALAVFGTPHLVLVAVPLTETIRSRISPPSKLVWALFLLLLPVAGVAVFHYRYRSSLFGGASFELDAASERARSGTLAPVDRER